ncbi:MAG: hypothetical protein AB8B64_11765 [Granulosicoccus sp.]
MTAPPLTHHDIIRRAAPLTQTGLKVNLTACDRAARYIEFEAQASDNEPVMVVHSLEVDEDNRQLFSRILIHECGLVSTLTAVVSDLETAMDVFKQIPLSRQIRPNERHISAHSYTLEPDHRNSQDLAVLQLRFVCAQVAGIELRIDTSTGGGMPADVRILPIGQVSNYLRETLADGSDIPLDHRAAHKYRLKALERPTTTSMPKLPDDILAILGPQWRPLRYQGDHWKGVLRQLSKLESRTTRAEKFIDQALEHLSDILNTHPNSYQAVYGKARWQVYIRRLQPVMVFIGILALMPISWLFVSSGAMTIHPLALGLTPLLMVGVVVLTAREIPVMEIPPRPTTLPSSAWIPDVTNTDNVDSTKSIHSGDQNPLN